MCKKKTPAMKQKKTASSASAKTFTKKVISGHTDLNGLFFQSAIPVELIGFGFLSAPTVTGQDRLDIGTETDIEMNESP